MKSIGMQRRADRARPSRPQTRRTGVVVQVSKDPVGIRARGWTTQVSLAGPIFWLMPRVVDRGISRKLPDTGTSAAQGDPARGGAV